MSLCGKGELRFFCFVLHSGNWFRDGKFIFETEFFLMMSRDGIAIAFCGKSKRSCPVMDGNATLFSGRRRRRRGGDRCAVEGLWNHFCMGKKTFYAD